MANQDLTYFVGKICSIFTVPCARDFKFEGTNYLQQIYHYFLGMVESIDSQGLLLTQTNSGLKTYIFRNALVAIAEEEVLDPDNAEDAKVIKEFQNQELPPSAEVSNFLDAEAISNMASSLKDSFGK